MPDSHEHEQNPAHSQALSGQGGCSCAIDPADPPSTAEASRYAQLLQAVGDAVITVDSQHRVTEFNAEAERVFGYAKTEILGKPINVLLPEHSRDAHDRHIRTFATEPAQRRVMRERAEVRGRRKDGEEFDAEISLAKMEIGRELHFMAVVRDVSGRKQIERDFRDSAQELQRAQELARLGSSEHDIQTGKVTWSAQIWEILGLDPHAQRASSELFLSMVHPDEEARLRRRYSEALRNREAKWSTDIRITRADGSERILHEVSELIWGEDGQLLRQVGALQDVTEQRAASAQLRLSKERLQRAQELTKLGSWEWNPHTDQMLWSDQLYRLLGLEPDSIVPSPADFRSFVHPHDLAQYEAYNLEWKTRAAAAGKPIEAAEFRIVRSDGTERWVQGRLQAILRPDGEVACIEGTVQDITEQRAAAERLSRSEEFLNRAQELAHLGSWERNEATGEMNWSEQLFRVFGLDSDVHRPSEELFFSIIHPDERAAVHDRYLDAVANRSQADSYEVRIIRGDGIERTLRNTVDYRWAPDGILLRVSGTSQDITEQKATAEKLRRSEQSLANAQRIAHIGNWDWNIEARTLSWSDEIYRIFGLQPREFLPSYPAFLERVHPDDRDYVEAEVAAALRREGPYDIHHRIVLPSGGIRTVHEQGEVVFAADGAPLQMNGTVQDVTEAKQAADELERSERILAQAQRIAKVGSWEADLLTEELRWSAEFYELSGLDPATHAPDAQLFLSLVHPDDRPTVARQTERAFAGDDGRVSGDYRMVRPDGTERAIHAAVGFIRDRTGRPVRVIGTIQDVTVQRAAEKELQAALEVAEAGIRAKSEFLANMSHELRTPLNAIIGFSELLLTGASEALGAEIQNEYLRDIYDSGKHLLDIVNELLNLSKAEAGELVLDEEMFELPEVIDWTLRLVAEKAKAAGVELQLDAEARLPCLLGDSRLIRQALLNLVSNATKFTPSGGWVRVQARQSDCGDLAIAVADSGIGMRPEDITVALTPFGQIDSSLQRRYEGTGLGLPLAKKFIELHGGELTIESAPMRGTTVTVTLPKSRCLTSADVSSANS